MSRFEAQLATLFSTAEFSSQTPRSGETFDQRRDSGLPLACVSPTAVKRLEMTRRQKGRFDGIAAVREGNVDDRSDTSVIESHLMLLAVDFPSPHDE